MGYIFPLFPAFAIIVHPWFATYRYRYTTATVGGAICVCAFLVTAYVIPAGPIGLAKKLKKQIAPTHQVVFHIDRNHSVENNSNVEQILTDSARQIFPIQSWRQFAEGREFEPTSAHTLIGEQGLKAMLSEGRHMWIWTRRVDLVPRNAGLIRVASRGGHSVPRTRH